TGPHHRLKLAKLPPSLPLLAAERNGRDTTNPMSDPSKEKGNGRAPTMPSREDPSPLDHGDSSSDEDTIRGDPENGAVAELSEDERPATPVAIGNGSVANRYREILQEQREESFDDSSVDD